MFYHRFYSVLFWIASSYSSELEKTVSVLEASLLPVCPLKTSGIGIFREETWMPEGFLGEKRAHIENLLQSLSRIGSLPFSKTFQQFDTPEQQRRTQLAIVSGPTGSLMLHGPGRAAFLVH